MILLASAPHQDTFGYSMPPPGLLRLGGALRRAGIEVQLDDLSYRMAAGEVRADDALVADCATRLARSVADLIGLSTMGATLPVALAIAAELKRLRPEVTILFGGPGCGGVEEALLERFPQVDLVVRGEAEVSLVEYLERGSPDGVAGFVWRGPEGIRREADRSPIDLADVAPYAWDLLPPLTAYKAITGEAEGLTPLDSGRGCAYDCSFCSIGRYWSRRSRPLPAKQLAAEVLALQDHEGAHHAYLCHDLFGAQREHALEFCSLLAEAGAPVPWEARARLDHLDSEIYAAMKAAGGYRVLLGVESADAGVRRRNQKGMKDEIDLLGGVDACVDAGITPILSLILGLPGEDEASLARTLDFCADAVLRAGVNLSLHLANPQPGCELGDEFAEGSRRYPNIPPDMAFGAGDTTPERELIEAHPDLFSTWHLLPWDAERLEDLHAIAIELPEVLMRYPRTFSVLRRRSGEGALALFRTWKSSGRSFEGYVLTIDDDLVRTTFDWERCAVRVAAKGTGAPRALDQGRGARATVELFESTYDLAALGDALRTNTPLPAAGERAWFAVGSTAGPLDGVRTLRVSSGAATLLNTLDGNEPLSALEARRPGLTTALTRLAEAGLVTAT